MSLPPDPPVPPHRTTLFEDEPTQRLTARAPAGTAVGPAAGGPADEPDDLIDDDWEQPRRFSRLTMALVIGILVVLAFAAGAFVAGAIAGPAASVCTPPPAAAGS